MNRYHLDRRGGAVDYWHTICAMDFTQKGYRENDKTGFKILDPSKGHLYFKLHSFSLECRIDSINTEHKSGNVRILPFCKECKCFTLTILFPEKDISCSLSKLLLESIILICLLSQTIGRVWIHHYLLFLIK